MSNLTHNKLASSKPSSASEPTQIGFLLLHNYTLISLACAVEPLRMANRLSEKDLYNWILITEDGEPVAASDGIRAHVDASIGDAPPLDALFVVGGMDIDHGYTTLEVEWLKKLDKSGVQLGGICTGAMALAYAHLLDGRECSMHWETMVLMQERHPQVECNNHLFTVQGNRITCSGGTAPLDMMLNIIGKAHGKALSQGISEMFILDRIRDQTDNQKVPLRYTMGVAPPKLIEATTLMEANIEEPLSLIELAQLLGISRRQMERLFKQNLDCAPSRYYLLLRLHCARRLLKQTSLSIIDISSSCGFVSRPHFSRCYASHMGLTPREERSAAFIEDPSPETGYTDLELEDPAQYEPHYGRVTVDPSA